jgi:hypothetical protein
MYTVMGALLKTENVHNMRWQSTREMNSYKSTEHGWFVVSK